MYRMVLMTCPCFTGAPEATARSQEPPRAPTSLAAARGSEAHWMQAARSYAIPQREGVDNHNIECTPSSDKVGPVGRPTSNLL